MEGIRSRVAEKKASGFYGPEEIEKIMDAGGARRRKVKRVFTPLARLQREPDEHLAGPLRLGDPRQQIRRDQPAQLALAITPPFKSRA